MKGVSYRLNLLLLFCSVTPRYRYADVKCILNAHTDVLSNSPTSPPPVSLPYGGRALSVEFMSRNADLGFQNLRSQAGAIARVL